VNNGLGATINIINGIECNGGNAAAVANRVALYKRFCEMLGVDPGPNTGC
jgi:chitinase